MFLQGGRKCLIYAVVAFVAFFVTLVIFVPLMYKAANQEKALETFNTPICDFENSFQRIPSDDSHRSNILSYCTRRLNEQ